MNKKLINIIEEELQKLLSEQGEQGEQMSSLAGVQASRRHGRARDEEQKRMAAELGLTDEEPTRRARSEDHTNRRIQVQSTPGSGREIRKVTPGSRTVERTRTEPGVETYIQQEPMTFNVTPGNRPRAQSTPTGKSLSQQSPSMRRLTLSKVPGLRPKNWVDSAATAADRAGRVYTDTTDAIVKAAEPVTKPIVSGIASGVTAAAEAAPDFVKRGGRGFANWLSNTAHYAADTGEEALGPAEKIQQMIGPEEARQQRNVEKAMVAMEILGALQGAGAIRNMAGTSGLKSAGIPREMIEKAAEIGRGSKRSARQVLKDFAEDPQNPIYDEIHAASSGLQSMGNIIRQAQTDPDQIAAFLRRKKAATSDYKPGQSLEKAPEIIQAKNRLLDSYKSGANREAFLGPKGLLRRRHPGKNDAELAHIYDKEVLPNIEKSIADTPARMFTDAEAVDRNLRQVAGQWTRNTSVAGSDEIAMSPKTFNKPGSGGRRAKEGLAAHELGHGIDHSPGIGKAGTAAGPKATFSSEQFSIFKEVFPWIRKKAGKRQHQDTKEIYTDIINSRATLGRGFTADDIRNIINNDGQLLRGREFNKYSWHQTPDVPGYTVVPLLNAIKETLRGAGIAPRNVPDSMLQNMADKFNQISQVEQPRREAEQPRQYAEAISSSKQLFKEHRIRLRIKT